jgi:protein-L-isoaspartate(D-aspartate) O-methyltransferase
MIVSSLRQKGVDDENVLSAIGRVPRHLFVPPELSAKAYLDSFDSLLHNSLCLL